MTRENDLYRVLFESSSDAIVLLEGARFVDCNASALALFGCAREELIGASPLDFSPPVQPDGRPSDQAAQQQIAAALSGEPRRFEWQHHRLDGKMFYALVAACDPAAPDIPVIKHHLGRHIAVVRQALRVARG